MSDGQESPSIVTTPVAPPSHIAPGSEMPAGSLHLLFDLDVSAAQSFKLKASGLLGSTRRPVNRVLRQVFWDSSDHRLGRTGVALGLQTQARRKVQVLREIALRPAGGRICSIHDSPCTVETDTLDLTRVAFVPEFGAKLTDIAAEMLLPIFGIDVARTSWRTLFEAADISVTLDRLAIQCAAGKEELVQLEMRLMAGPPGALYRLARNVAAETPLRLAELDPIQRAYGLLGTEGLWSATATPDLNEQMSVRNGFLASAQQAVALLRTELRSLSEPIEAERIHRVRVAIRRLRSLLSVFQPVLPDLGRRRLSRKLNDYAQALGAAREWDVFLESTVGPIRVALGDDPSIDQIAGQAAKRRASAITKLHKSLTEADILQLGLELGSWFDAGIWPEPPTQAELVLLASPLIVLAKDLLRRRHRKLVAAGRQTPSAQELHELRIQAKRLRYTVEALRTLYPAKPVRAYLAALKEIQETLGAANDATMAQNLIPHLAATDQPGGARALGLVTGWNAAHAQFARDRFVRVWHEFQQVRRFWK